MDHPYRHFGDVAFWKRAFFEGWECFTEPNGEALIRTGEAVGSAGSCFAANIVPRLERAGFHYVRREAMPPALNGLGDDNFNYRHFSAAYGNIYTARQALQMLKRALGRFRPKEDRWVAGDGAVIDAFRPGLKYPASSMREFDLLTEAHLAAIIEAFRACDVFAFTLGLTEAWVSKLDGAVFPVCPGSVAGTFDPARHHFVNFSVRQVAEDLDAFIALAREINPRLRFILTVSPGPLVATASGRHVLLATVYSKSVLRVAAQEMSDQHANVVYFPAYEIVTGPQAPHDFFLETRRDPSERAIKAVMDAFLARCEGSGSLGPDASGPTTADAGVRAGPDVEEVAAERTGGPGMASAAARLSAIVTQAKCEEEALGLNLG